MRRAVGLLIATLLLAGLSCSNKVIQVNVNTDEVVDLVGNVASQKAIDQATKEAAVLEAKAVFAVQQAQGVDLSAGPCLTNSLMPDWVADVAHDPRQPVDDLPENQCVNFLDQSAHHFVELDPNGQLIRAQ